jgi:hypothetical protein
MPEFQHTDPSQEILQRNWSGWRAQRQRQISKQVWPPGSTHVGYGDRVTLVCGHCHEPMGHCVTFQADDLRGILDDVATTATRRPLSLYPREGRKPYWLHVTGDGRRALATFHCRRCSATHTPRNAHRLASEIIRSAQDSYTISS